MAQVLVPDLDPSVAEPLEPRARQRHRRLQSGELDDDSADQMRADRKR